MNNIEVYIGTKLPPDEIQNIINIFYYPDIIGNTRVSKIDIINTSNYDQSVDQDLERINNAFRLADPNSYVIICRDDIVGLHSPKRLLEFMDKLIQDQNDINYKFDVFYLCKWLDKCDDYFNKREVGDMGNNIVNTIDSNGLACIMFSPCGRQKFHNHFPPQISLKSMSGGMNSLSHKIKNLMATGTYSDTDNNFFSMTTQVSLIKFDINKASVPSDYLKTAECKVPSPHQPANGTIPIPPVNVPPIPDQIEEDAINQAKVQNSNMTIFWIIFVILIVIIIVFIIVVIYNSSGTPKNKPTKSVSY